MIPHTNVAWQQQPQYPSTPHSYQGQPYQQQIQPTGHYTPQAVQAPYSQQHVSSGMLLRPQQPWHGQVYQSPQAPTAMSYPHPGYAPSPSPVHRPHVAQGYTQSLSPQAYAHQTASQPPANTTQQFYAQQQAGHITPSQAQHHTQAQQNIYSQQPHPISHHQTHQPVQNHGQHAASGFYQQQAVQQPRPVQTGYANGYEQHQHSEYVQSQVQRPQQPQQKEVSQPKRVAASSILKKPGRHNRPTRICIIVRGLPGSGKTRLAKIIKEMEMDNGGASAPRIYCLDDYYMTEVSERVYDKRTGRTKEVIRMEYKFEPDMEQAYMDSAFKAFKKTLGKGSIFPFVIVENINVRVSDFENYWRFAKSMGFEVYVMQLDADVAVCARRNVHNWGHDSIERMHRDWEETPPHMVRMDVDFLGADGWAEIEEVEMEIKGDDSDGEHSRRSRRSGSSAGDGGEGPPSSRRRRRCFTEADEFPDLEGTGESTETAKASSAAEFQPFKRPRHMDVSLRPAIINGLEMGATVPKPAPWPLKGILRVKLTDDDPFGLAVKSSRHPKRSVRWADEEAAAHALEAEVQKRKEEAAKGFCLRPELTRQHLSAAKRRSELRAVEEPVSKWQQKIREEKMRYREHMNKKKQLATLGKGSLAGNMLRSKLKQLRQNKTMKAQLLYLQAKDLVGR